MEVVVLGMGYVGCVTAAVLAREGHDIVGIDSNAVKIDMLVEGRSPVLEPGLPELIAELRRSGRLQARTNAHAAIGSAEVIVVCVGTPSKPGGGLDGTHLMRVAEEIGAAIAGNDRFPVVVLRSTALPEMHDAMVDLLQRRSERTLGEHFGFAVNPEFLREGSSIADFYQPQFTLIGTDEERSARVLRQLYAFLDAPIVHTDRRTAALVKYACNAFHAVKVAFANEIGTMSKSCGVDGQEVMRIFCLDRKLNVSPSYLRPGMPFGGSCLPKDTRAILHHARQLDLPTPLLVGAIESNRLHTDECTRLILSTGRKKIGVFGMAFKAGTDDLRESPIVEIIEYLIGKGAKVSIYDKRVSLAHLMGANREYVEKHLPHIASLMRPTVEDVLDEAETLVVANSDDEFRAIPQRMRSDQILIDLVGIARESGLDGERYVGVGW